jgi:DNA mismatch endonuclease, patch repair protein
VTDRLSRDARRALMARVRNRGTEPEVRVRVLLRSMGYRPTSNERGLAGSPDLVLRRRSVAIFVHGCFWHRHKGCPRASIPSTSQEFWLEKFDKNVTRDRRAAAALRRQGWSVVIVWECQTGPRRIKALSGRLARLLVRP